MRVSSILTRGTTPFNRVKNKDNPFIYIYYLVDNAIQNAITVTLTVFP